MAPRKILHGPVYLSAAWIMMLLVLIGVSFIFLAATVHKRKKGIFVASLRYHRLLKPIQITTILPAAAAVGNLPPSSSEHFIHVRSHLLCSSTFQLYYLTLDENPHAY